ncbi:MAG TPA: HD domain-containing phosphohydrolase [Gemmatimonadaceae bacterium]|nr:HD domain-containing phosphohydrolase [Gemmatimonadaceae bacterium]
MSQPPAVYHRSPAASALVTPAAQPLLLAPSGRAARALPLGNAETIELRRVAELPAAGELDLARPTVVLIDKQLLKGIDYDRRHLAELAGVAALVGLGDPGETAPESEFPIDLLTSYFPTDAPPGAVHALLRGAFRHAVILVGAQAAREDRALRHRELAELTGVGVALSTERNLLALLEMILTQARRMTSSDAGSLYLVERGENGSIPTTLRFRLSQNYSLKDLPVPENSVPIDHTSLAGYTATTGEPLVIEDVYLLPSNVSYRLNRSFDEKFGYRTKSMLVIPMRTHRDEIIGVLQLLNRKRHSEARLSSRDVIEREVVPYDQQSVELVSALASQAAVAIENSLLYEDIERLFEGFVTAAVTAIEQRDPTTSGHSGRVARFTVSLAEAVGRGGSGPYRGLEFTREQLRELRYAGLLHDFGKVGVREQVLIKQKKLYPWDLDIIRHRFAFLLQRSDLQFERDRADYLLSHGTAQYEEFIARLEQMRRTRRNELNAFLDAIVQANEPTVLPEGSFEELKGINERMYIDFEGVERPLLRDEELRFLMIRKGNLDDRERREIESHVTHTFRFLEQIPWTSELRRIPEIAYGHHEKLNGTGYPRHVMGAEIPVQTRMMTIADIFDALTATDRPYKRAVPAERALDILSQEAKEGMIDLHLLRTFVEAKIYLAIAKAAE